MGERGPVDDGPVLVRQQLQRSPAGRGLGALFHPRRIDVRPFSEYLLLPGLRRVVGSAGVLVPGRRFGGTEPLGQRYVLGSLARSLLLKHFRCYDDRGGCIDMVRWWR